MPGVLKHNRECDNGFEQYIFNDDIMDPVLFDSYDDFIIHSWPVFVEDNSYS